MKHEDQLRDEPLNWKLSVKPLHTLVGPHVILLLPKRVGDLYGLSLSLSIPVN